MKLLITTNMIQTWFNHILHSTYYRSWQRNNYFFKCLQKKIINISCLAIIAVNLLAGLLNINNSYQFYGIICLIAVGILLISKNGSLPVSRWAFIGGINLIVFYLTIVYSRSTPPQFLFLASLCVSLFLFSKDEIIELAISLTIPVLFLACIQMPGLHIEWYTNQDSIFFNSIFFINIACILMSVILSIVHVFYMYEKSNQKLRMLVGELQDKEREISLQNRQLLTLNADLIASQDELIKNELFLHTIIDNLPVMLFVKDAKSLDLIRINKTGERLLHLTQKELLEQKLTATTDAIQAQVYRQTDTDREVLQKGKIIEQEEQIVNKNSETYVLHTRKIPIYDNNGKPLYLLGISEDITRRKLAEEELKRTVEELKIRNYELDNYVYRVSHDLRAPFCSMQGLINLSKAEQNIESMRQYMDMIEKSVTKSDRFIQSILNHSKILNSEVQVSLIDFEKIVQECFEDSKYMEGAGHITLTTHISGNQFYNDEFTLSTIVKNLISNAVKYMNPSAAQKFIEVKVEVSDTNASISIADNGYGIEKEHLPKIFNMFFRGSEHSSGSGLGLYIARQAVEKLNGTISVESQVNKGTLFRLELKNMKPAETIEVV